MCAKIGGMPFEALTTHIIVDDSGVGLGKLWKEHRPTAKRICGHIRRMCSLAIAKGYCPGWNDRNPASWEVLQHILSKRPHTTTHHPSVPYKDAPRFVATLRAYKSNGRNHFLRNAVTTLLIEFIVLTGGRSQESRLAEWKEFDLQNRIWTVPWQHLKTGKIHKTDKPVPITPQMLKVLQKRRTDQSDQSDNAPVFPSPFGGLFEESSCSQFVRNTLKSKFHIHGCRATFTDWAEANGYAKLLIDLQLGHVGGTKVDQAYRRDQHVEQRRLMMEAWCNYLDQPEPAAGTNVAQIT